MQYEQPLKILILAAEIVPFAKVGGLADVVGALPKSLQALGHDVRLAMPRYGQVDPARFDLQTVLDAVTVNMSNFRVQVSVRQGKIGSAQIHTALPAPQAGLLDAALDLSSNSPTTLARLPDGQASCNESSSFAQAVCKEAEIPVYMIDAPRYFERENIYGYTDDGERFILFCRSVLEAMRALDWSPDIIHCHDWHTGIVPNWMHTIYRDDPFYADAATVSEAVENPVVKAAVQDLITQANASVSQAEAIKSFRIVAADFTEACLPAPFPANVMPRGPAALRGAPPAADREMLTLM